MEKEEFYNQLVDRYVNNQATEEELEVFFQLVKTGEIEEVLKGYMSDEIHHIKHSNLSTKHSFLHYKWASMVACFLIVFTAVGLFYSRHNKKTKIAGTYVKSIVVPGGNKAILTLANGEKISLTNAHNGLITIQQNMTVNKVSDGHIIYAEKQNYSDNKNPETDSNTLVTPHGGTYKITLPDGTNVWLNALSSIRFPVVFKGNERKVDVSGEVYFEVTKDAAKPFIVKTAKAEIRVLGTHFNIMAYADEPVFKTTLLEGSIQIKSVADSRVLKPFEQAILTNNGKLQKVENKDAEDEVAWKNGDFQFKNEPVNTVMRQVGRWYNVSVVNNNHSDKLRFTGKISRKVSIDGLIEIFKFQGIDLSINKETIIIN